MTAIESNNTNMVHSMLKYGANADASYNDETLLYLALKNINIVKLLIEHGADIYNANNNTPLIISSLEYNYLDVASYLIENYQLFDIIVDSDYSLLGYFTKSSNYEVVELLVEKGFDPNKHDCINVIDAALSAKSISKPIIRILLQAGANIPTDCTDPNIQLLNERKLFSSSAIYN